MKILRTYKLIFIVLVSGNLVWGQGARYKASAELSPHTILIGDQVEMDLRFSVPKGTQVIWPTIQDTILGNIRVIGRTKIDTTWAADKQSLQMSQSLKLTCFDSGFYTIPPIHFFYRNLPDTTMRSEATGIQVLTVHTLAVDTTQAIKPIKGPVKVGISILDYLGWIITGFLFIAIAAFLTWYYFKRKRGEPIFVLRPAVKYQPHEWALMELEKLRAKKIWQSGKIKDYHTGLTDILRKYIEDRFHLMAMESTTGEILDDLEEKTRIEKGSREILSRILTMADLVKFAKYLPLPDEHEQNMEYAVEFVNKTYTTPDVHPAVEKETSGSAEKEDVNKELKTIKEPVTNKIS